MNKKVVLITTGQPSTNPRLVKEADSFCESGFEVTVLYQHIIDWASAEDVKILRRSKWNAIPAGGNPEEKKISFKLSQLSHKFFSLLNRLVGNSFGIAERAQLRSYGQMLRKANKLRADWYIGHNLGALAIAVKAAKHNHAKAGFDFEDYYRGEHLLSRSRGARRVAYIERKYASSLSYVSAASSLISKRVAEDLPELEGKITTINNCFPKKDQPVFREEEEGKNELKLFWFSQTIGLHRGLELLLEALVKLNDSSVHLTLAGRCDEGFKKYLDLHAKSIAAQVHFAGIIPPDDLPAFSSRFDVGMALELSQPENRNLCLTNKVFTYLLAGNAIILSKTNMQDTFNAEYNVGLSFAENDVDALVKCIRFYQDSSALSKQRRHNYELAGTELNWETEFKKMAVIVR